MHKDSAISLLEKFEINDITFSGESFIRFPCPFREFTHKDHGVGRGSHAYSMDISLDMPKGNCFVCGDYSKLSDLLFFLALLKRRTDLYNIAVDFITKHEDRSHAKIESAYVELMARLERKAKSESLLQSQAKWFLALPVFHPKLSAYLDKRRLLSSVGPIFGLRYDSLEDRVVLPFYDMYNTLNFFGSQGRTTIDAIPKAKCYPGSKRSETFFTYLGSSPFSSWVKKIILMEGPFDLMTFFVHLFEFKELDEVLPLCLMGSQLSLAQEAILEKCYKPVYIMLDNDEAGEKGARDIYERLKGRVPMTKKIHYKGKDPDELSSEEFAKVILQLS